MNKKRLSCIYFFVDWIASILAWTLFYFFRKAHEDLYINYWDRITNSFTTPSFWLGVIIIPICWLILHAVTGAYEKVYFKSRLRELGQTFFITLLGVVVLFFVVILDDEVVSYKSYYQSFIALFLFQFLMTYIPRLIITTSVISRIRKKKIGFNTLIVGSNDNACAIFKEIEDEVKPSGRRVIGFLNVYDKKEYKLGEFLPHLGSYHDIEKIVKDTVTVTVEIPAETKERETRDSTSVLETSIARSTARLTWTDGQPWLFHSLENKPQQIQQQAEVDKKEKTRIEYKTRYVTKTKYVEVKKPFPWWCMILMWAGGISLAVLAIGIILHVIGKDINRLL